MKFISTKDMTNETAPKGQVLVQYLEPSWGGWSVEFGVGYFDNPDDYEDPDDGEGWKLWFNDNNVNVIGYYEFPQKVESKFTQMTQLEFIELHDGDHHPNLGNVGE